MNLCRCENGHFYDKEKFPTCPHCVGGSATDDSLTTVFTEDVTMPVEQNADVFEGSNSPLSPFPEADLPIADIPANQATEALDFDDGDSPTVQLHQEVNSPFEEGQDDEDDDHTIGFFDDDFFSTPQEKKSIQKEAQQPANLGKTVSKENRIGNPCVGWLVALSGAHIGTDFRLKVGKNFIGRSPKMDIALTEDKSVSRERQAIVVYEPKEHLYLVQPGEASTLVYKNNEVVLTPCKLEAYDVITVGDVNLLFIPLCNKNFNWSQLLEEMKK